MSKISIELALRGTFSTLGVYNNTPYLEVDFTHQSGLDTSTLAYFEVKKSVIFIKINEFIQLEKFQKINEFLLNAAVILLPEVEITRHDQSIRTTKKIPIPLEATATFYESVAKDFLPFLAKLDEQQPKIFEMAKMATLNDEYQEKKVFTEQYEKIVKNGTA